MHIKFRKKNCHLMPGNGLHHADSETGRAKEFIGTVHFHTKLRNNQVQFQ